MDYQRVAIGRRLPSLDSAAVVSTTSDRLSPNRILSFVRSFLASGHGLRSADFQVGCIADFQIREPEKIEQALEFRRVADLEIGDATGLETCTARAVPLDAPCPKSNPFALARRGLKCRRELQHRKP
jgi:hypothetical protein